jgi:glycerol kinase
VIAGLTAATVRATIARAAIDAIAQRTTDVVEAMAAAIPDPTAPFRVDGGLTASLLLVQRLADLAGRPIEVAAARESTALGVALMAAIGSGRLTEREAAEVAPTATRVGPELDAAARRAQRAAWRAFVRRAVALEEPAQGEADDR